MGMPGNGRVEEVAAVSGGLCVLLPKADGIKAVDYAASGWLLHCACLYGISLGCILSPLIPPALPRTVYMCSGYN